MVKESYRFIVEAEDKGAAGRNASNLADVLREAAGVLEVDLSKADDRTMDLGAIISVLATPEATLAIARGLAAWLQARRGVTLTIARSGKSGSLKLAISGIDPETAERIVERVV